MSAATPTPNEAAGMAWWNEMTEKQRGEALQLAKANTAAQAWDWYQLNQQAERETNVATHTARIVSMDCNSRWSR